MSLLPFNTFPGMVFLEARMLAQSSAVISQVGVSIDAPDCSIALFSKTSGVLLVAGVGSYCAYRICTNFLGRRFVWMLLESSRLDAIPTADRRLLYDCNISYDDSLRIVEIDDNDEDDDIDRADNEGDAASVEEWKSRVSESKSLSQISRSSRLRTSTRGRGLFSIRHAHRPREGVVSRRSSTQGSERSASPSMSERSASLQIVWEGGQDWDDEFANAPSTSGVVPAIHRLRIGASTSTNSQPAPAPSVGDLCSIFDDVMSVTSALDNVPDELLYNDNSNDEEEAEFSHIKCLTDSKYMYSSLVAGSEFGSEAGSITGSPSRLRSLRRKRQENNGLWDITSHDPGITLNNNSMTDSALTRSTHSKKSSHGGPSMFDSAIGTDLLSSEDESVGQTRLNPLQESDNISIAQTDLSMEWYEDEGLRYCNGEDDDVRLTAEGLDWEMDSATPIHRNKNNNMCVSQIYRPSTSRDLMVVACQQYQPYSPQFKILHELYHRQRFRKLGQIDGDVTAEKQIQLLLHSLLYHQGRLSVKSTWTLLQQKLQHCLEECDFLHKWKGRSQKDLEHQLRALWDVVDMHMLSENEDHIKGFEILLVLEAKTVYDEKMKGFAHSWFDCDSPANVMHLLEENKPLNEILWNLICRICDLTIEMVDLTTVQTTSIGCGSTMLPWIRQRSTTLPLFYVPED